MLKTRITLAVALFLTASFITNPAFAQNSLSDAYQKSSNMNFTCSYASFSCLEASKTHSLVISNDIKAQSPSETPTPKTRQENGSMLTTLQIEAQKPIPIIEVIEARPVRPSPAVAGTNTFAPDNAIVDPETIFTLINSHRKNANLPIFEKEATVCELAKIRSTELAGELAKGVLHSGLYNRNLPYWIWENAKVGSDENGTVDWWLHSPIHRASIDGDYKYSCVACTGSFCSELFTSFAQKELTLSAFEAKKEN